MGFARYTLSKKFYVILSFGIYATMIRRNPLFPILFLIWFMTFPILKSLSVTGINFYALGDFRRGMPKNSSENICSTLFN